MACQALSTTLSFATDNHTFYNLINLAVMPVYRKPHAKSCPCSLIVSTVASTTLALLQTVSQLSQNASFRNQHRCAHSFHMSCISCRIQFTINCTWPSYPGRPCTCVLLSCYSICNHQQRSLGAISVDQFYLIVSSVIRMWRITLALHSHRTFPIVSQIASKSWIPLTRCRKIMFAYTEFLYLLCF